MEQKLIIGALIIIFLVVVVYGALSLWHRSTPSVQGPTTSSTQTPATPATTASSSLGTQIYGQSQNPIQNKVPTPSNPAANPIKGIYKNPF